jgi:hypothetical protein
MYYFMNGILVFKYKKEEEEMMITNLQNERIPINLILSYSYFCYEQ